MPKLEWAAPTGIRNGPYLHERASDSTQRGAALKPRTKKLRLLEAILEGPKTSFELEKAPVFDHCPNSTVSEWRKLGIGITTEMITVSGYGGEPAHIARYSISPESRDRVMRLVGEQP
jgi:hypothetical protein